MLFRKTSKAQWRQFCVDLYNNFHGETRYDEDGRPIYFDYKESILKITRTLKEIDHILQDEYLEEEWKIEQKVKLEQEAIRKEKKKTKWVTN